MFRQKFNPHKKFRNKASSRSLPRNELLDAIRSVEVINKNKDIPVKEENRAHNSFEAFQYLRSGQSVDLIIINIPSDQSDNFRFLAHFSSSSLFYSIPTVVLSNSKDSQLRTKIKALGASLFLNTPFDPVLLMEKVKEIVHEKESRRFLSEIQ